MSLKLIGEVSLDGSGFERGLNRLGSSATHNFRNLVAAAFGFVGVHQAIHRTVESADELVIASGRLDLTIEQLQILRQAAKESGVEFGKLETALERINVARAKALGGDPESLAAFARLGVSKGNLKSMNAGDIFSGPISAATKSLNAQDLAAPMTEIFKNGFGVLTRVLRTDFEELENSMRSMGAIMGGVAAREIKLMADQFSLLSNIIAAQLAPALVALAEWALRKTGQAQGVGGFWGALSGSTGQGFLKSVMDFTTFMLMNDKEINEIMNEGGARASGLVRFSNGVLSAVAADESIVRGNESWLAKIKALAAGQPPNAFEGDVQEKEKKKGKGFRLTEGDSMVRVGNFLGTGQDAISRIGERTNQLLTKIEQNTRPGTVTSSETDEYAD